MNSLVETTIENSVARIRITRPDSLNALSEELKAELIDAFENLEHREDVVTVVLSGEGRAFCAGADKQGFASIESASRADIEISLQRGEKLIQTIMYCPKVVIAAIHGYCIGGGVSLALASDIAICAEDTVFFTPEVDLGLPYLWGSTALLTMTIGRQRANHLILTCDRIDAMTALDNGIVSEVLPAEQLENHARALAQRVAMKPRQALFAQKRLSNRVAGALIFATGDELAEGLDCVNAIYPGLLETPA